MGVRTTEQVKLSVEHADVAVMCLGLDATIEGEQGDAGNEYARKRHRSAMGGTQPECESHRGLLVSGSQRWQGNCRNAVWRIFPLRETAGEILSWNRKSSGVEY